MKSLNLYICQMNTIAVRIANASDAELIADLSRKTFYDTFASFNTKADMDKFLNEQFTRQKLMDEVKDGKNIFLLAYDDEQPVGYAKMQEGEKRPEFDNQPSIEISRIYAVQTSIGKGIGKLLMQNCIDTAKQLHRKIIWLGVWQQNAHAIAFYKKWGFEKFAEHDFLLGDDLQVDWLMKKSLG